MTPSAQVDPTIFPSTAHIKTYVSDFRSQLYPHCQQNTHLSSKNSESCHILLWICIGARISRNTSNSRGSIFTWQLRVKRLCSTNCLFNLSARTGPRNKEPPGSKNCQPATNSHAMQTNLAHWLFWQRQGLQATTNHFQKNRTSDCQIYLHFCTHLQWVYYKSLVSDSIVQEAACKMLQDAFNWPRGRAWTYFQCTQKSL